MAVVRNELNDCLYFTSFGNLSTGFNEVLSYLLGEMSPSMALILCKEAFS